jgi:hypothetical protein
MATTTNYGWTTPDNTAYVKDGASAIRTLGSSVDTSLFNITNGKNVGMSLLHSATFTTSSAFQIDNIFTSAYTNYRVVLNAKGTTNARATFKFRKASADVTGGYTSTFWYFDNASSGLSGANNANFITFSDFFTSTLSSSLDIMNPLTAASSLTFTNVIGQSYQPSYVTAYASGGTRLCDTFNGFSIMPSAGTMTGKIQIYGYRD